MKSYQSCTTLFEKKKKYKNQIKRNQSCVCTKIVQHKHNFFIMNFVDYI